jgi:hypothetical protein
MEETQPEKNAHHQYVHFFIKNRIVVGLMSSGTLRKNLLAIFDNLKGLNHARGQRRWAQADDAGGNRTGEISFW